MTAHYGDPAAVSKRCSSVSRPKAVAFTTNRCIIDLGTVLSGCFCFVWMG